MEIPDTNRQEVAKQFLQEAQKAVKELGKLAVTVDEHMQRIIDEEGDMTFPILWATMLREKLDVVMCEISRCNGAVLVRATEKMSK